jgi:hypothetical protein
LTAADPLIGHLASQMGVKFQFELIKRNTFVFVDGVPDNEALSLWQRNHFDLFFGDIQASQGVFKGR